MLAYCSLWHLAQTMSFLFKQLLFSYLAAWYLLARMVGQLYLLSLMSLLSFGHRVVYGRGDFELLNLRCLLLSDGITGIHHCAWFIQRRRLNPRPCACQMSSLLAELPPSPCPLLEVGIVEKPPICSRGGASIITAFFRAVFLWVLCWYHVGRNWINSEDGQMLI